MKAAILAVGSELLGTDRLDTNSLLLTRVLWKYGVPLARKAVVADEVGEIAKELARLLEDAELVLVSGGLGPTADDVSREAVAQLTGRKLRVDEVVLQRIQERFCRMGREMPEVNRRQAEVIQGAKLLANAAGTAPGQHLEVGGRQIFLFPGVPGELEGLVTSALEPWLGEHSGGGVGLEEREIVVACLAESAVEELIAPAYEEFGRDDVSVLARPGEVRVRVRCRGSAGERGAILDARSRRLLELVGDAAFSDRADETLERVVGRLLSSAGVTVGTAESCTGGLVAQRLTNVAGSSRYFTGGLITYTNELKTALVGISPELLVLRGAVSQEVAEGMAQGVRQRLGTSYGIGLTGIAGPGGGSASKPVGTVHIALAGPGPRDLLHREERFLGDRERVRWLTSQLCLDLLRRDLLRRRVTAEAAEAG